MPTIFAIFADNTNILCAAMSALYIHIPFCKTRCSYCDFYKSTSCARCDDYIAALEREMSFRHGFFEEGDVPTTLFFGGGTPSVYPPQMLQRLIDRARSEWGFGTLEEVTVEANPDDITDDYLAALAATEVNRLSMGVQSFVDRDLKMLGRRHDSAQAINAVRAAQRYGFGNISIDLMFGIPGMTQCEWEENLATALSLGVQHISAYALTIEPASPLGRRVETGAVVPESDEVYEQQFRTCHDILTSGGFEHYEISNFALGRGEFRSRHNYAYWSGVHYLGLGPSAHSYNGSQRIWVADDLDRYIDAAGSDVLYGYETLSPTDKYNEFIMTALRTSDGLNRTTFVNQFGVDAVQRFEASAAEFVKNGDIIRIGDRYVIPYEKFMVSNAIISELFCIEP